MTDTVYDWSAIINILLEIGFRIVRMLLESRKYNLLTDATKIQGRYLLRLIRLKIDI